MSESMRDPIILHSAVILIAALALAQLIIAQMARRNPERDATELKVRTRSWWIIVALVEAALYGGKITSVLFFACISFFGLREYLSRVPTRTIDRKALFWVFLAIPIQFYFIYREWLLAFLCFVPVYGITVLSVRLLLIGQPRGFVMSLSSFQLGLLSTVYSIGHIAYLTHLSPPGTHYEVAAGSVLFLIVVTQLNDVFQFISGKTLGKNKIMPLISPKKTVEGFLGGVVLTSLLGMAIGPWLVSLTPLQGLGAGACLAVFGFFGDVLMSAIKRDLEIKDFSQLIPGHGGVLDRIDSLTISSLLYFHLMRIALGG